jgi:Transposase DDE domain
VRLSWEYVTKRGGVCELPVAEFCTRSKTGRSIKRHRDQNLLDRARRQANTRRARLDRKRRQHLMERSFADAANRHGFKRARWRGLVKQSIQDQLIATIQNLRKLIGAIQNVPQSSWKPLIRTLSCLCMMLSALFTPDRPGRLVFASI